MSDRLKLEHAVDLMRRLPPQHVRKNVPDLIDLAPDLCEELLSSIDQPLEKAHDKEAGKDYLLCDYNRDGDSYRSPWSNQYDPPLADGTCTYPSEKLRKMEIEANDIFDTYREMYFEGGLCSVYLMDLSADSFVFIILIKKSGDTNKVRGSWDSIHVMQVKEMGPGLKVSYKLISTVMLWLQTIQDGSGTMDLGGSIVRQVEEDHDVNMSASHITNIGRMIEDMENKIRSLLDIAYFGKTKDILSDLRSVSGFNLRDEQLKLVSELQLKLKSKK